MDHDVKAIVILSEDNEVNSLLDGCLNVRFFCCFVFLFFFFFLFSRVAFLISENEIDKHLQKHNLNIFFFLLRIYNGFRKEVVPAYVRLIP